MNNNDTNTRGKHRSTLKSNPRASEGTIVGNMLRIMQLVEDNEALALGLNKKLRSKR